MKRFAIYTILAVSAMLWSSQDAQAWWGRREVANCWGYRFAQTMPWHGDYSYTPYGMPTALVVPPTANMQTSMGWGVTQSSMRPIYHQFGRPYPGDALGGYGGYGRPTPRWPSHTDQFGVYYVRGPW